MSILLAQNIRWSCPNCTATLVTGTRHPFPQHRCRGLKGLFAPFVEDGQASKVFIQEREDYVRGELVQTDGEGRPVSSIVTVRDDGSDCKILAPAARVGSQAKDF
jgi:hypothetical protein